MDLLTSLKLSSSGLAVQRQRMEAISSNLANMETTRTAEGGPYRRKDVVVTSLPLEDDFDSVLNHELGGSLRQVMVTQMREDQTEARLEYKPDHPDANEAGYVSMPNIDLMSEMVNLVTTSRSFEANVTVVNATKSMALRAIDLGR